LMHQSLNESFAVYPNPVEDVLYIDNDDATPINVKIYNMYGNLVTSLTASGKSPLSVKELTNGVYIVEVSIPQKGISRKRFMKR